MSDADKVRAAADYIEAHGLHKGSMFDFKGSGLTTKWEDHLAKVKEAGAACCTAGALSLFHVNSEAIREPLAKFIGGEAWDEEWVVERIPDWNDAPERTQDEVVTALRAFADTLDAPA